MLFPLLDRAFMACSTRNHPFFKQFNGFPVRTSSFDIFNVGARINRSTGLMLTLRSCFNDCRRPSDQKARAFAPQLARDLEVGAGKPVQFSDISKKVVVAVDVDEGSYLLSL